MKKIVSQGAFYTHENVKKIESEKIAVCPRRLHTRPRFKNGRMGFKNGRRAQLKLFYEKIKT